MFDDIKKPPEDIFAGVDQADVPPPFRTQPPATEPVVPPIQPPPSAIVTPPQILGDLPPPSSEPTPAKAMAWKPIILIVLVAVVVIAAGAVLSKYIISNPQPVTSGVLNSANTANTAEVETGNAATPPVETNVVTPDVETVVEVDTDKDGLTDAREAELGTNPNKVDTDDDGLFDLEEAETYHTNPLSPDTDGDGYKDGDEVENSYNPNGAGKLFELPGSN